MGVKRVGHDWVTFTYTGEEQINVKKVLTRNKQNKIHYTYSTWKSNKRFFSVFLSLRHLFTFHFYFYFINFPFLLLLSVFYYTKYFTNEWVPMKSCCCDIPMLRRQTSYFFQLTSKSILGNIQHVPCVSTYFILFYWSPYSLITFYFF